MIILYYMPIALSFYVTGMATLQQYQRRKRRLKLAKTHGVQVETFAQWNT
jgi:hypothetical protein